MPFIRPDNQHDHLINRGHRFGCHNSTFLTETHQQQTFPQRQSKDLMIENAFYANARSVPSAHSLHVSTSFPALSCTSGRPQPQGPRIAFASSRSYSGSLEYDKVYQGANFHRPATYRTTTAPNANTLKVQRVRPYHDVPGRHPLPRPSQIPHGPRNIDDIRRRAETDFYERHDTNGRLRRKSMIRSVDKEDYLLARGANPRTGIVTPGVPNFISDQEEDEILRARGLAPSGKWRQKDDQWLSFDAEQPTPLIMPEVQPPMEKLNKPLKTLERGLPQRTNTASTIGSGLTKKYHDPYYASRPAVPPLAMDGTVRFAETPSRQSSLPVKAIPEPRSEPSVKRKPVGSPPASPKAEGKIEQNDDTTPTERSGEPSPNMATSKRSSSAPQRTSRMSAKDLSKELPQLPEQEADKNDTHPNPFLESDQLLPWGQTQKYLPSLPTSNGQVHSTHSGDRQPLHQSQRAQSNSSQFPQQTSELPMTYQKEVAIAATAAAAVAAVKRLSNARSHYRKFSHVKVDQPRNNEPEDVTTVQPNIKQRIFSQINIQELHHPQPSSGARATVLTENPDTTSTRTPLESVANQPEKILRRQLHTVTTTSMNTDILTNMSIPQEIQGRPVRTIPTTTQPTTNSRANVHPTGPMTVPNSRLRPRAATRPSMPIRTERTRNVPRLSLGNIDPSQADLQPITARKLSNTTITNTKNLMVKDNGLVPEPLQAHLPLIESPTEIGDTRVNENLISNLTRKCSRCHNGIVTLKPADGTSLVGASLYPRRRSRAINGKHSRDLPEFMFPIVETPDEISSGENRGKESTAPLSNPSTPFEGPILIDHAECCPECCEQQDCHGGCIARATPSPSLIESGRTSAASTCPSSASSADEVPPLPQKAQVLARNRRLAFVRGALRKSFTRKAELDSLDKRIHDRLAELATPASESSGSPFSSQMSLVLDGRRRSETAMLAAKSAIGVVIKDSKEHRKTDSDGKSSSRKSTTHSTKGSTSSAGTSSSSKP